MKTSKIRVNEKTNVKTKEEQDKINNIRDTIYSFLINGKFIICQEVNHIITGIKKENISEILANKIYEKNKNI